MLITDSPPPPVQTVNFKPPTNLETVRLSRLPILFVDFGLSSTGSPHVRQRNWCQIQNSN